MTVMPYIFIISYNADDETALNSFSSRSDNTCFSLPSLGHNLVHVYSIRLIVRAETSTVVLFSSSLICYLSVFAKFKCSLVGKH